MGVDVVRICHLRDPSSEAILSFLGSQESEDHTYADVGASQGGSPAGFDVDHHRMQIGIGVAAFEAAIEALLSWRMFPPPWTRIEPGQPPVVEGRVVVIVARVFGLWWLNACRVVYLVDESAPVRRVGFAYGTLPGHVECGEERFTVEHLDDDSVWYDLRAFSRPRHWLARMSYPVVRRLQRRFVRESMAAMKEHVARAEGRVDGRGQA